MVKHNLLDCNLEKCERLVNHFQTTFHEIGFKTQQTNLITFIEPHTYNTIHIIQDLSILIQLIRSRWYCVQEVVLNNEAAQLDTVRSAREFINQAFDGIIQCLLLCDNPSQKEKLIGEMVKYLKIISCSVVHVTKLKESALLKIVTTGRSTCPVYQYLHSLLEIQYYILVSHYLCCSTEENMKRQLEVTINNLALIAKTSFKKFGKSDMCNCVKFSWLAIQLITEKIDVTGNLFWSIFNRVLDKEMPLFALSLLNEMSSIQCFNMLFEKEGARCERIKSNYEFLELKFKELLSQTNCDTLAQGFRIIDPLICHLWLKEGRINLFQFTWDFYSKRLNVSNRNSCNISAMQFIETLDTMLSSPKDCTEDFEIYVGLLIYHLREYPMHWGKLKGRIYSQLGPNKVKDLSDIGLRHVMLLFLALSSINFEELEKKIIAFQENLPAEKKFTPLVWNMYGALILKYVREGRSIEKISPPMLRMLQEASMDQKMFHLIKEFIKNLQQVVLHSVNMQLHQWLLFGPWLGKYQSICYFTDLNQSLNVILLLLERCSDADSWSYWEACFKDYIYPNLRHLAGTPNAPAVVGTMAGKLALLYTNLTTEYFAFFNSETISPKISSKFLEVILENYPNNLLITPQQENIIVQSWVKICLLTVETQCELTRNVIKLDIFPPTLKTMLKTTTKPIYTFIEYLGNNCKLLNIQSNDFIKICDLTFGNLDKTLAQYLVKPESEEIVFNIYHYIALAFLNCGNLLYNKNKPVTPLTKLTQTLLLPMDFLTGKKTPHNFVLNAVKKTWPTFFEAIMNLNSLNDPYLERTLKDLVIKYIPYFSTSDSPVVSCLENPRFAELILDKIYVSYFKPPVKESDANTLKALKIVSDLANSTTSLTLFTIVINKVLYGLFEVVIFHPQRSTAIGVIKSIISSRLFKEVKNDFNKTVLSITEKNLGLNTINCFQLLICLAKFVPDEIRSLLGDIKGNVANVERLRGVGFDKTLRLHIEKLENALQSS